MIFILVFEFLLLFILSRKLTSYLSLFFYKIFKSSKISVFLLATIFLPGTIIHEFSHAVMAKLLFVHVGEMELMPKLTGESLKLGSVKVGKADIIRSFFIGIAPFVMGALILFLILFFGFKNSIFGFNYLTVVVLYMLFVISNTMYSSKKDMEGAVEFIVLIIVPIIVLYFLGVRIPQVSLRFFQDFPFQNFLQTAVILFSIPLILDSLVIILAKIVIRE